jgi:hypothetical protein
LNLYEPKPNSVQMPAAVEVARNTFIVASYVAGTGIILSGGLSLVVILGEPAARLVAPIGTKFASDAIVEMARELATTLT